VDWFKVETRICSNEKVNALSNAAFRSLLNVWAYAMQHENGGHVPSAAHRLIPRVTPKSLEELEGAGFIHRNGDGWEIHDWEQHQAEALALQDRRRRDLLRKRAERAKARGEG
jgi:hypothetical protein